MTLTCERLTDEIKSQDATSGVEQENSGLCVGPGSKAEKPTNLAVIACDVNNWSAKEYLRFVYLSNMYVFVRLSLLFGCVVFG